MVKKIIQKIIQKIVKPKFKPKFKKKTFSQNIGVGKIKQDKLYNVAGTDKYGEIKITTKGPQVGFRVPLDKKKFTDRRPWAQDPNYKKSPGERVPAAHIGSKKYKPVKKAHGGLVSGFPKIATKGWK
jgi:hypothetical protein